MLTYSSKLSQAIKESTDVIHRNIESVKEDTGLIQTHVRTIESGVVGIRQEQDRAQHEKLMEWISPTDFPAQQSDFIARRQEGTGQWFHHSFEFTEWLHGPNKTLFCPGIPGAGKTMISAIAVDHLSTKVASDAVGIACVYCNYKVQDNQTAAGLLAAILKQLVHARLSIAEPVDHLHEKHANRGTKPSLEEIFGALQSVIIKYSSVYIVVDALDECSNRNQFLAQLRDLQSKTGVRLMVTSRVLPDIEHEFSAALRLDIWATDADVKQFVAGQTDRLPNCIKRDKLLQKMVQKKIMEGVGGM